MITTTLDQVRMMHSVTFDAYVAGNGYTWVYRAVCSCGATDRFLQTTAASEWADIHKWGPRPPSLRGA
ncbi:hypothetical protein PP304_gp026 [Gordonia phage Phendrix]|uniref:Uncharacterized protein n=1 Tax=Gordonia phage Phendrix TaxID=2593335 RepID=A0A514U0V4_9CAUD|nr:hypothetical protein PP304_gp026 [Gordonia phage Phendrix]QDK02574.1 hypothetical protein SEA_PHENDRIX_26 [Gordonia phage Phendrix]